MKLRTLKKAIHREGTYRHEPRYNTKICMSVDGDYIHYYCQRVVVTVKMRTGKAKYVITKRGEKK